MKNIFLVDADGTVLDFHKASKNALKDAFKSCGLSWEEDYLNQFKIINDGLWEALERKEISRDELIEKRFPIYLSSLGLKTDGAVFNQAYLNYLATHPIYIDGAEEFLKKLKRLGQIYIVTNGTTWIQKSRFKLCNLLSYVNGVFISNEIGADKPAKEYTEYVLSHIPNFEIEKAVWIGDSLSADIKASNEANITSIWYNPERKPSKKELIPSYNVDSFDKILAILQHLCG